MRYLFCIMMILISLQANASYLEEMEKIKQAMVKAVESQSVTDSLYSKLTGKKSDNALIIAYIGTLEALKAKHSWNPYQKVRFVSLSQKTMAKAISLEPYNLQIRFMRFSIQHYTPQFLGYSNNIKEDLKIIIRHYKEKKFDMIDESQIRNIASFVIASKRCPTEAVQLLKKYI